MTNWPIEVKRWETSDGELHGFHDTAVAHQEKLGLVGEANVMLAAGTNLADVLDKACVAYWPNDRPILAQITIHTGITIEHWQCRKEPGYKVSHLRVTGSLWVYGHAGSWSGPYGADVSIRELLHYAAETAKRHGGKLPPAWTPTTETP